MAELVEAAEAVEEAAAEAAYEIGNQVGRRPEALIFGSLAIGIAIGATAGFFWTRRRLEKKYQQMVEDEIDEMREHFRKRIVAKEEKPELDEVIEREGYAQPNIPKIEVELPEDEDVAENDPKDIVVEKVVEEVEVEVEEKAPPAEVRNIFEDEWDYEEEIKLRRPERPYVIHVDERHERDYTETSLIYYGADDVLADRQDRVIDGVEKVVGVDNLDKFGHGSGDPNVVYVRNDVLGIEMEIVKNDDAFATVVHGFVQHQYDPDHRHDRRQKQRFDDDPGTE